MAGPVFGHKLPLDCAVTGDAMPLVQPLGDLAKLVYGCAGRSPEDKTTMMRQLMHLRDIVRDTLKASGEMRCMIGSCDGEYLWFPMLPEHSDGILDVKFFDRLIATFMAASDGDGDAACEIASDILSS